MRYIAVGYKRRSGNVHEGNIHGRYSSALHEAMEMLNSDQYKVILVLRDSEGEDHPSNSGKFFLHRIIK